MKFRFWRSIFVGLSLVVTHHQIALGAQASQSDEYVIGPGDVLSINDNAESTTNSPILPDGTVVINHAGVIEQRPAQVYVLGAVSRAGLYSALSATDESSADLTKKRLFPISEALKMAGGLKDDADIRHIHITRQHPKQVMTVDLWKLVVYGEAHDDLTLLPGDVIYVPRNGNEVRTDHWGILGRKVCVRGLVKNAGLFAIKEQGENLMSVITLAGGFDVGAKSHTILIARICANGSVTTEKVKVAEHGPVPNVLLKPGDVVTVQNEHQQNIPGMMVYTQLLVPYAPVGDFGPYPIK